MSQQRLEGERLLRHLREAHLVQLADDALALLLPLQDQAGLVHAAMHNGRAHPGHFHHGDRVLHLWDATCHRGQGSGTGQYRGHRHGQHRAECVPSATAVAWVGDLGEVVEQATALVGCEHYRGVQPLGGCRYRG